PSLLVVAIVVCCGKGGKIFDFSTLSTTLCSSVALNLAKLHLVCQVTNILKYFKYFKALFAKLNGIILLQ
ncbi:MAG: hypothetical protein IJK06_07765, partial [Clostridia bacterium]|nr:hypothetical protein [Clostridia bacterium]